MRTGVILLNFGEPENPTPEEVIPFLERIFTTNASLEGAEATSGRIAARSRELAEARAPGLIEEYAEIGGSPLHAQAREQAELLEAELRGRGRDATCYLGMQFTSPAIAEAVEAARAGGAKKLVGLPIYPLCGPSTTVAALEELSAAVREREWGVDYHEVTGWHRHPAYTALRARGILDLLDRENLSLVDERTALIFSAHGTPLKYIREGSRYADYVADHCAALAKAVGASSYEIGYQNHANRPVEWTQPDVESVIGEIDADRVIVVPVSFMHEQSETLAELDGELREKAEGRGLEFHRVGIPHAAAAFISLLADLVEPFLERSGPATPTVNGTEVGGVPLRQCLCRPTPGTCCLNAELHAG